MQREHPHFSDYHAVVVSSNYSAETLHLFCAMPLSGIRKSGLYIEAMQLS